jgi:hypothetical protein
MWFSAGILKWDHLNANNALGQIQEYSCAGSEDMAKRKVLGVKMTFAHFKNAGVHLERIEMLVKNCINTVISQTETRPGGLGNTN